MQHMPENVHLATPIFLPHCTGPYLRNLVWGGGRTAWPKATARGRVREGDVPPPARSAKAKFTFNS